MHPNSDNNNRPEKENNNPNQEPPQPQDWRRWLLPGFLLFILLWLILTSGGLGGLSGDNALEVQYSDLRDNVSNIDTIIFESDELGASGEFGQAIEISVDGESAVVESFSVNLTRSQSEDLLTEINAYNATVNDTLQVRVRTNPPGAPWLAIVLNLLPFLLIVAFFIWMMRRAQGQVNGVFSFGQSRAREYDAQMPRITFDDVAGQEAAKRELVEVVDFLKEPEKYISLGARIPRGVLLVGPPGTGKTLMARAVAGEANVAFYSIAASEFVEMFVGVGASRVRDLFTKAKDNSPSIVFIDEIDAVGRQRGAGLGGGNDEREQTLNQMLSELDGFDQSSTVIVMAATNRPDVLDPALLRPGRFDRQVTVDLPDREGRMAILKIHTRGKPLGSDVDLESMAGATIGFSGADLANLANEAALYAARNNRKKITQGDFSNAFERIILGIERPPLSDPHERQVTAYHEAGHAVTALLTDGADQVLKVTITPRGFAGGITAFIKDERRALKPKEYYESEIKVGLGGRAAESIVFGQITAGAAGDIRQVTQIARRMVTQWGMSKLGMVDYSNGGDQPFLGYSLSQGRQYSEETAAKIDTEIRGMIDGAYEYTTTLLTENRDKLDAVANALLEREVLEREELLEVMGISTNKPLDNPEELMVDDEDLPAPQDVTEADDPFALFANDDDEAEGDDEADTSSTNGADVPQDNAPEDHPEQRP